MAAERAETVITPPAAAPPAGLTPHLIAFARLLRANGLGASTLSTQVAARALLAVEMLDRRQVFHALRASFCARREDLEIFGRLFPVFWTLVAPDGGDGEPPADAIPLPADAAAPGTADWTRDDLPLCADGGDGEDRSPMSQATDATAPPPGPGPESTADAAAGDQPTTDLQPHPVEQGGEAAGYSPQEVLVDRDLGQLRPAEVAVARRHLKRLVQALAQRPVPAGPTRPGVREVDFRRSYRWALRTAGELVHLCHRRRVPGRLDLVALCDVSGSMEPYTDFSLHFIYVLAQMIPRSEVFAFSTRLSRVTPALRLGPRQVGPELRRLARHWAGGTRLGDCLRDFNEQYGEAVCDDQTTILIFSDGWDRGDVDVIGQELARLKRRVARIVWLNPLAGSPGFQPLVRGLVAAMPYLDLFLPAHSLQALSQAALAILQGTAGAQAV